MIKFEFGVLVFAHVEENQFFIDKEGCFCQKYSMDDYCVIANEDGVPCCDVFESCDHNMTIKRKLPHVKKITWGES